MTNRVAAQNARDRRKQYVEELESKIALLESKVCLCVCMRLAGRSMSTTANQVFIPFPAEPGASEGEQNSEATDRQSVH